VCPERPFEKTYFFDNFLMKTGANWNQKDTKSEPTGDQNASQNQDRKKAGRERC
jgi:hypothetical protein